MEKLVMERRAYDNKYLHRDFHATLDIGIAYLGDRYGEAQLDTYIARYVQKRYRPMTLQQLQTYFADIYAAEEAEGVLHTELTDRKLTVKIDRCPGLDYLNAHGGASKWYYKTTTALYPQLAKLCGFDFRLLSYNEKTGEAEFEFVQGEGEG